MNASLRALKSETNQTLTNFSSPGTRVSESLSHFVRFAAKTASAEGAFLLLNCNDQPTMVHTFGELGALTFPTQELISACHLKISEDANHAMEIHPTSDRSLLATIVIQRNDLLLGILGVCDAHPGSISAAQSFVLQAIARELGDQLHGEHLGEDKSRAAAAVSSDLLARLRLLESVVVNATDSVVITKAEPRGHPGPRIQYVNPAFTRTTGYTLEDVIGKSPRLLQGPLSGREGPNRIKVALEAWEPVEVELLNYRKDGTTFWVELSISPVCDETGWYTHWVSVQRDVTERKAHEENIALMRMTGLQNAALSEEIRERKLVEAELSYVAFHDGLTGVRNRNFFMDTLGTAIGQVRNQEVYRAAVIYLDLDGFKQINDTLGHRTGDLLLTEVAQRLKGCARAQDTLARLGGDEFTLLVNGLHDMQQALNIAQRMLDVINAPVLLAGMVLQVSASVGLCEVNSHYLDADSVLRDADIAMYCAKRQGGTQCVLFDQEMHRNAAVELLNKLELKTAVERHEFELHYQPLVNMKDQSICGVEALIRWNHPTRGFLAPGQFIPLAEEIGLIVSIGTWVLHQSCFDFRIMQRASQKPLYLSVNVSSRQLDEVSFFGDLERALRESGVAPKDLQLEITESIFLKEAERVGNLFRDIRALGVRIAFDDFGTGYSSLSYVEKFPIDTLKIDQSFVQHMVSNSVNADIVKMIIRLAHTTGMTVSAEGVETAEQADILSGYGCTLAQGFLYSRALSLNAMTRMLVCGLK